MLILLVPILGLWVRTDGSVFEAPCPDLPLFQEELRLPAGCVSHRAGFWQSMSKYRENAVQLAEARATVFEQQKLIEELKRQLNEAQNDLIICRAIPECLPCKDNSFKHILSGAVAGSLITSGGCLIWTLSR